jgi:hypothetical protein
MFNDHIGLELFSVREKVKRLKSEHATRKADSKDLSERWAYT